MKSKKQGTSISFLKSIGIIILVYGILSLGALFKADVWYENLEKPLLTPPEKIFPIVWNTLYFFIALSIILLWNSEGKRTLIFLFGTNFLLNILWSLFFFGLHHPVFAFLDLLLLIASTISIMVFAYARRKSAAFLLTPYLGWLLFALYLNYQIAFVL